MGLKKLLLGALLTAGFCVTAAEPLSVKMSNLGLEILSKDLGNISMGSRIVAVEPPWVQLRFYSVWAQLNCINQGNTAEMKQAIDTEAFKIINYSAVADGNTVTVKFSGELREDVPTAVEYSMFAVPAFLLAGSSYTVTYYDGAKSSGTIPQIGENTTNAFIKRAQKVEFEGTYGKLTVESVKGPLFDVVDRRLYTFEGESVFWFGKLVDEKEPLKFGEVYDSELKFTFEPTGNTIFAPELANINDGLPMEQVEDERGILLDLGDFILNLADITPRRYLKVNVAMELSKTPEEIELLNTPQKASGGHGAAPANPMESIAAEMEQYKPAVRDAIISVMSNKTSDELSSATGKELAKEEIKEMVNTVFNGQREVLRVSFGQFIIQ